MSHVYDSLVMFGGSKSGVNICSLGSGDWRWGSVNPSGTAPDDRRYHSASMVGGQLTFFGGSSLADGADLADMFWLSKAHDGSWAWGWPSSHTPYVRYVLYSGCLSGGVLAGSRCFSVVGEWGVTSNMHNMYTSSRRCRCLLLLCLLQASIC